MGYVKPILPYMIKTEYARSLENLSIRKDPECKLWYGFNTELICVANPDTHEKPYGINVFHEKLTNNLLSLNKIISRDLVEYIALHTMPDESLFDFIHHYNDVLHTEIEKCEHAKQQARILRKQLHLRTDFTVKLGFQEIAKDICDVYRLTFNGQTKRLHWVLTDTQQPINQTTWKKYHNQLGIDANRNDLGLTPQIYAGIDPNYYPYKAVWLRDPSSLSEMTLENFIRIWYGYIDTQITMHAVNPYKIRRCRINRLPGNKDTKTFDFIDIEVCLCMPKEQQKHYVKTHRDQIHNDAMAHLESDFIFKIKNTPINFLEAYDTTLTRDGIYIIRLQLKKKLFESNS